MLNWTESQLCISNVNSVSLQLRIVCLVPHFHGPYVQCGILDEFFDI